MCIAESSSPVLAFAASCQRCGSELHYVNGSVRGGGTESVAVVRCEPCRREYFVDVILRPIAANPSEAERRARHRAMATVG